MERSRKILLKIASSSNKVVAAAEDYADRKDSSDVQHSHFQLEAEMQKISVACEHLASNIGRRPLQDAPAVDERLKDWVGTGEPRMCLDTLEEMETLLREDMLSQIPTTSLESGGSATTEDKIDEAVSLLSSRKGNFHFLFLTETGNNEWGVQQKQVVPESLGHMAHMGYDTHEQSLFVPAHTNINTTVPDTAIRQDGHMVAPTHVGPVVVDTQWKQNERKLKVISIWLDGLNCAEKQDVTLSRRQPDTCSWLFDTTQYRMWRNGAISLLWLHGKPGAGKSVLASSVIESLEKSRRGGEILAFFYCDFTDERSSSASEAIRSILSQLLRHLHGSSVDLGSLIHDLVEAMERGGATRNNTKELTGFACRAAALLNQSPLVIVDGLDECKDVETLLEGLVTLRGRVRLFVTSRPLPVIKDGSFGFPFISMDDMVKELSADIELHVTRELNYRRRLRQLDVGFKREIRSLVCSKADGMFRWVHCSIETLNRCVTEGQVQTALSNLPEGLHETYERILLEIDTRDREGELAQRALTWLVAAVRPLRLAELLEGLFIDLQTRTLNSNVGPMHSGALLDACGGLVTYTEKTDIIVLSHLSVKEYLMGELILTKLPLRLYHINWERAHLQLARSCMCYLSICLKVAEGSSSSSGTPTYAFDGGEVSSNRRVHPLSHPLCDYVLDHSLHHFQHLGQQFESVLHDIKVLERDIQQHTTRWDNICLSAKNATHFTATSWPTSVHDLNLYILVAFAPDSLLRMFLRSAPLKPKEGTNPLVYAAHFNKAEHAQTLLSRGAELNRKGWDARRCQWLLPIEVALRHRHYAVVDFFVAEGCTVPPHIFTDSFFMPLGVQIPSSIAKILLQTDGFAEVANDPANESVMQLVRTFSSFSWSEDTDEQDLIAIIRRFTQVVDLTHESDGEAFLLSAIEGGHCAAARHLLALGIPLPPGIFFSLNHFGRWRKAQMICFLVENGADVLVDRYTRDSVLHILLGDVDDNDADALESTRLLVARGCNPLRPNIYGRTPLHIAIERELVSIARFFLSMPPLPPDLLLTARPHFRVASLTMLRLVVENGADPLTHDNEENCLLHHILTWNSEIKDHDALEVTKFLVDRGCSPLKPSFGGKTPLHVAVEKGFISVARYLLSKIQVGTLPPDLLIYITRRSSWNTGLSMLRLLVENGGNVLAHNASGDSVLYSVLKSFNNDGDAFEATKLLVSHGCEPYKVNCFRQTPLHIAIRRGFVHVARYLLSLGAPLPRDPLLTAMNCFNDWKPRIIDTTFEMVRLLIENGANACACTLTGESMLHIVLRSHSESDSDTRTSATLDIARLLVGHGCNPLEINYSGKTPLRIAIEHGHVSVVRYLLSIGASWPEPLDMFSWSTTGPMICFLAENVVDVSAHFARRVSMLHIVLMPAGQERRTMITEHHVLEATKVLVTRGCDPFKADSYGKTPLHFALQHGYLSVAQYLLSLGVHSSPDLLLVALKAGLKDDEKVSLVRYMVGRGVNVHEHTVLHVALQSFHEEAYALDTAKLLVVSCGCDQFGVDLNGQTPLHIAVKRGQVSVVRFLLTSGISPTPSDLLPIALDTTLRSESMSADKRASLVRCLVDNGADVHVRTLTGDSVLHNALQLLDGDYALETAKFLVGYGCDTQGANSRGQTPLHIAVERGHTSVTRYLLQACGVRPSPDLLFVALNSESTAHKKVSIVCCLVENGANVDEHTEAGDSVIHVVLQLFKEECWILDTARLLVSYGCDPHEVNSRGKAPLRIAIERGYVFVAKHFLSLGAPLPGDALFLVLGSNQCLWKLKMISFLIDQGASVLDRASSGDTVLHRAVVSLRYREVLEAVTLLLNHGCHLAIPNARGDTPLDIAVQHGRTIVVKHLISLHVPLPSNIIFTAIQDGSTFGWTRRRISLSTLEALVISGCDTRIRNASGLTPLDIAILDGRVAVVDYLLSVGDIPSSEDLDLTIALAPPDVRNKMSLILSNRLTAMLPLSESSDLLSLVSRSESPELSSTTSRPESRASTLARSRPESPELPPAKRIRYS